VGDHYFHGLRADGVDSHDVVPVLEIEQMFAVLLHSFNLLFLYSDRIALHSSPKKSQERSFG
jgi:hypothetical protein